MQIIMKFLLIELYFHLSRSRSQSRGSLFGAGGNKNSTSTTSLDSTNSHPGSRRVSRPSILVEPDPEIYGEY